MKYRDQVLHQLRLADDGGVQELVHTWDGRRFVPVATKGEIPST